MSVPIQPGLEAVVMTTGANPPAPVGKTYSEEEYNSALAKVRQQEKDKLYPQLSQTSEQLNEVQKLLAEIQKEREDIAEAARKAQEEKEAAIKAKQEAEMDAKTLIETRLKERDQSWETKFQAIYDEREAEKAKFAKEREYNELVEYRNGRLTELANDIAPQFHGFINGNSKEEIDAAIAKAQQATQSIFEQVQGAQTQTATPPRGVSATGYSAMGPMEGVLGQKTYTAEDFKDMSMADYEEFRQKSGMAGRDASRSRGLFG